MKSLVVRMCKEYSPILYSLKNWHSACGSVLPSGIMVLRNLNLHCKQQQQITNGDQICENECVISWNYYVTLKVATATLNDKKFVFLIGWVCRDLLFL